MDMRAIVTDRVANLRKLDVAALKALPPQSTEVLSSEEKVTLAQYHEISESGEHKIIVQITRSRWLGLSTAIEVEGFVVVADGTRRPLADQEKWDYL
jgi:hypothetical protein